jgi:hypothetical protein
MAQTTAPDAATSLTPWTFNTGRIEKANVHFQSVLTFMLRLAEKRAETFN